MKNIRKIFKESFYGDTEQKNCVLEFTYPQMNETEIDGMDSKFSELLKQLGVDYSNNYRNINKTVVICKPDKLAEVKTIAKSLGLSLQNELIPDSDETNHL